MFNHHKGHALFVADACDSIQHIFDNDGGQTGGRLKVLATISKTRSKELPNVPTLIEEGYPAATVVPWYMLLAPSGTPKDIVAKFNEQITKVMAQPDVIEKLEKLGGQLIEPMKPAEIDALIRSDYERWGPVIQRAKLKAE